MSDHKPVEVSEIDRKLARNLQGIHRIRWITLALVGVLLAGAVAFLSVLAIGQQHQLRASCAFWSELSGLPITVASPSARPSRLGVELVVSARAAFTGQSCGRLMPADPSVIRWAVYYHIALP